MANMVKPLEVDWNTKYWYFTINQSLICTDEHKQLIHNLYQDMYNDLTSESDLTKLSFLKTVLQDKIRECKLLEDAFVNSLSQDHNLFKSKYEQCKSDYKLLSNLFTDYFIFHKIDGKTVTTFPKQNDSFWFKIILSSVDFTKEMMSTSLKVSHQFSRAKYANNQGQTATNKQAQEMIIKDLKNGSIAQDIAEAFKQSFSLFNLSDDEQSEIMTDLNNVVNSLAQTKGMAKMDETKFKNDVINKLRDNTEAIYKHYLDKYKNKIPADYNFTISVGKTSVYLSFTVGESQQKAVERLYREAQSKYGNEQAYNMAADIFYDAIVEVLSTYINLAPINLDLLWAQAYQLNREQANSAYQYAVSHKEYIINIIKEVMSKKVWSKLSKSDQREILSGEKNAYGFTQSVIGYLGEIVGALNFASLGDVLSSASGAAHDYINIGDKKINLGQSFADIQLKGGGVNIKHYIAAGNKSFSIYESSSEQSIAFSDGLFKYIDKDTLLKMRFLETNYSLVMNKLAPIDKPSANRQELREAYNKVAIANLDSFIRQTAQGQDFQNIFYELNNTIVPSSAIYQMLLSSVNKDYAQTLFTVKLNTAINPVDYNKIPKKGELNEHNILKISKIKSKANSKGATLYFNGIAVDPKLLGLGKR